MANMGEDVIHTFWSSKITVSMVRIISHLSFSFHLRFVAVCHHGEEVKGVKGQPLSESALAAAVCLSSTCLPSAVWWLSICSSCRSRKLPGAGAKPEGHMVQIHHSITFC